MDSGGSGAWRSRARREAMTKPGEPHLAVRAVHHDIGRFDVLVDEAALVELAQSHGNTNSQAQETSYIHGRAKRPIKRLAARILEHQHGPTAFAHKLQRQQRPRSVEFVLQSVFVGEAIEA